MPGWTNKGKFLTLDNAFRGATIPTNFFIALVTSAVVPTPNLNTLSELTEIAAGNGYTTGGVSITPNVTDFDSLVENDTLDRAEMQIKDIVWTAAGGPIPSSGSGARYAVMTDDNVTIGSREVYHYWDLVSDRTISDTQSLTLQDTEIQITET